MMVELEKALATLERANDALFDPNAKPANLDPRLTVYTAAGGTEIVAAAPLIHTLYFGPPENARLNALLRVKEVMYRQNIELKNWWEVLLDLVERPYRIEEFASLRSRLNDQEYWPLLGAIWTDSENVWQYLPLWKQLLRSERPLRDGIMEPDERAALAALPDPIPVYHGVDGSQFAWSTDRKVAEWFAHRYPEKGKQPRLMTGLAPKEHVIAYFTHRNEKEVLIFPEHVLNKETTVLPPKTETENAGWSPASKISLSLTETHHDS